MKENGRASICVSFRVRTIYRYFLQIKMQEEIKSQRVREKL